MALIKRKAAPPQPIALDAGQPEPPAPDLAGAIMGLRSRLESFLDDEVARLRASRDGQSIPPEQLRHMLTQGSGCLCAVAMHILAEQSQ